MSWFTIYNEKREDERVQHRLGLSKEKRREEKSGRVKMPTLIASPTPGANPQCTLTLLLLLLQSSSIRTVLYTYTNSCVRGRPLVNCWQHSLLSSLSLHPTHTNTAQFPTHTDTLTHSHAAVQQNPQSPFHELNPHHLHISFTPGELVWTVHN